MGKNEDAKKEYLEDVAEGRVNPDMDDTKAAKDLEKARKEKEENEPDPFQHEKDWAKAHDIDIEDK